jgi:hypothetical protein
MITVKEFPLALEPGDEITFTHEGVTRAARVNYRHVFNEPAPLANDLRLAGIGLNEGLTLLDAAGQPIPPAR